jgi:hypothetical protein
MLRVYAGSGGNTLTVEEPLNNIVRVALEVLASALGGVQAIHSCSYDEAYAIPTAEAQLVALRTQQIIAYESGITKTVDPLAGSYYVETLTQAAEQYMVCFRRACVNCASPEPTVFLREGTHRLGGPMTIDTPLHAEHQLDQLAGQFAHWRQTRPRPFAPIPSALWDQAVALAAALPPARVAHHIRVRVADLTKQMVARQVAPLAGPAPTSLGFVEVPPAPARPQATPTMQLELSRADGTRLSIHGAASTVPLETVLRAFLEGR